MHHTRVFLRIYSHTHMHVYSLTQNFTYMFLASFMIAFACMCALVCNGTTQSLLSRIPPACLYAYMNTYVDTCEYHTCSPILAYSFIKVSFFIMSSILCLNSGLSIKVVAIWGRYICLYMPIYMCRISLCIRSVVVSIWCLHTCMHSCALLSRTCSWWCAHFHVRFVYWGFCIYCEVLQLFVYKMLVCFLICVSVNVFFNCCILSAEMHLDQIQIMHRHMVERKIVGLCIRRNPCKDTLHAHTLTVPVRRMRGMWCNLYMWVRSNTCTCVWM